MKRLTHTYRTSFATLSDRHPRMARGLALLFLLAGIILSLRVL